MAATRTAETAESGKPGKSGENGGGVGPVPASVAVEGQQLALPVEVRSASMVAGTFTAPATAAQHLIAYSGLRVRRVAQTLAVCTVAAVRYTDSDLGPYNEIALGLVVEPPAGMPRPDPEAGPAGGVTTFIHRLPVNQSFTCAAGQQVWGFPKWVADISYQPRAQRTDVVMMDGGKLALAMTVTHRGAIPVPATEITMSCLSWRDGTLRATPWSMRLQAQRIRPGGLRVEIGQDNQLADDLAALRFPKTALLAQRAGHMSATFGPAVVVS